MDKASQWCILNRKHANILLDNTNGQTVIFNIFKNNKIRGCLDEYTYITILNNLNLNFNNELKLTNNLASNSTTFANWLDCTNYKNFKGSIKTGHPSNYNYICPEELDFLINSKSLFARKFNKNCRGLGKIHKFITI